MSNPTTATGRHLSVDALRGFALFGILLVNIEYLVQPIELGWAEYTTPLDHAARGFIKATSELKVYPVFAMLFGYGFALQHERSGDELGPRYRRRMWMLMAMGVLHGVFFFPGDILLLYGVIGLITYWLRNAESARLVRIAAIVYGINALLWLLLGAFDGTTGPATPTDSLIDATTNGSLLDVAAAQLPIWLAVAVLLFAVQGPVVVASYCLGMAVGRTDLLSNPEAHRETSLRWLRLLPLGLGIGALGAWLSLGPGYDSLGTAIGIAGAPLVGLGYVAGVVRLPISVQRILQPSGRMSLTVYLLESIVAAGLAMGYGFGWIGRVSPIAGLGLVLAIWSGLSVFAHMWMRRFRFGPFEWLLRSFSYGKWQPLRASS